MISCRSVCQLKHHNPFQELVNTAQAHETPLSDRISINKYLAQYLEPILRSIEHTRTTTGEPVVLNITLGSDPVPVDKVIEAPTIEALPPPQDGYSWKEVG